MDISKKNEPENVKPVIISIVKKSVRDIKTALKLQGDEFENFESPVAYYEKQIKKNKWPLGCIKCNKLLTNLGIFNIHMTNHWFDEKNCPVCDIEIDRDIFSFKQHLKIHTNLKPFMCNVCKESFGLKSDMIKHMTSHIMSNSMKSIIN